jgi:hypothetical protein
LVKVIQADGLDQLANPGPRGDAGDPYPGTADNHDLTDATTPNAKFDTGAPSGLNLHVDSTACAPTMQIDVTAPGNASAPVTPPANDNFADATTISGNSGTVNQSTKLATEEPNEPVVAGCGLASVWYRWTAPSNGNLTLSTMGSGYDTVLGLFTGSAVNALTLVAANDDEDNPGGIYTSKVVHTVAAGTTYRIAADGCAGGFGRLQLAWNFVADAPPPPPAKIATTTTASAPHKVKYKRDFDVTATVTASAAVTGTVTVMDGSKLLGTGPLANGTVKIHITKNLKPGKHTLTVAYGGSDTALASSTTVTVKVKKRHHH